MFCEILLYSLQWVVITHELICSVWAAHRYGKNLCEMGLLPMFIFPSFHGSCKLLQFLFHMWRIQPLKANATLSPQALGFETQVVLIQNNPVLVLKYDSLWVHCYLIHLLSFLKIIKQLPVTNKDWLLLSYKILADIMNVLKPEQMNHTLKTLT